jgi:hypothetical protein
VTNSRLANNAVTSGKVTDSTLTTHDVNNGTLSGADVSDNSLTGADISESVTGAEVKNDSLGALDIAPNSLGGSRIADNSLTGADINESTLAPVPSANPNADTLDGIDSTGFTRPACTSQTGAVKGFARINARVNFPSGFTTDSVEFPYNCSGGTVQARRVGQGHYIVRFNGNGARIALASPMIDLQNPDVGSVGHDAQVSWTRSVGTFSVTLFASDDDSFRFDEPFSIVLL